MPPVIIILIIIGFLLLVFIGLGIYSGVRFYNVAMNRSYTKGRVSSMAKNTAPTQPLTQKNDFHTEWFEQIGAKDVAISSFDGLRLQAWLVQRPEAADGDHRLKFAILCHGYTGFPEEMGYQAIRFYEQGFSILAPSARGHAHSEGNILGMGWKERLDLIDWIKWINKSFSDPEIILYGISMGAATVMMASGENLPENVRCIIEDCGFSSVYDQYKHSMVEMMGIPVFPFMLYIIITTKLVTGINLLKDGWSTRQLARSKVPVFFVHGSADRYVPFRMLDENYSAHPGSKEKMIVENAPHIASPWMGGDEYWERIMDFINRFI